MSRKSESSNVSRRHFLAVVGSVAAASPFALGKSVSSAQPPPASSPVDYPITIDITTPNTFKYSTPTQSDASVLKNVTANQTFTWAVKTPKAGNYRVTIFFLKKTPFADVNKKPVFAFEGDSGHGGVGGKISGSPSIGTYKYYVAVFDDESGLTCTDDPKIIVGDGDDARTEIALALGDLKDADAKLTSRPKLQRQIEYVEHKLEHLIDDLK